MLKQGIKVYNNFYFILVKKPDISLINMSHVSDESLLYEIFLDRHNLNNSLNFK